MVEATESQRSNDQKSQILTHNNSSNEITWTAFCDMVASSVREILSITGSGCYMDKQAWLWIKQAQEKVQAKKRAIKRWQADKTDANQQDYVTAKQATKSAIPRVRVKHYQDLYNCAKRRRNFNS
ncbi:hypothetical protein JRQ81_018844 [Phrynocephalus forsythii]|uniref:Uncharacterized protein n=1 Tax=Phrynocephalus forsythii TaxID=171643 RepID=A0A9Q0XRR4_9SAUR|nr:hypothetical protein JRQ81_018844 [Phrynocephalus forsythii]